MNYLVKTKAFKKSFLMWAFQSRNQDENSLWTYPSGAEMKQVCDSSAAEQIIVWLTDIMVMRNFWRSNVYLYQLAKNPTKTQTLAMEWIC